MLQSTALRLRDWPLADNPVMVVSAGQANEVRGQLEAVGVSPKTLIVEPCARDTAPAVALAALASDPNDLLLIMPSDHIIGEPDRLCAVIELGVPIAEGGWLVTFGIQPQLPETGYGYIKRGPKISDGSFAAEEFLEKPGIAHATSLVSCGEYYWNSGILLFRASTILDAFGTHSPEVLGAASAAYRSAASSDLMIEIAEAPFARSPAISIDYAIMEKAEQVAVVPVSMSWSDVGSWGLPFDSLPGDEHGSRLSGPNIVNDVRNCLIQSDRTIVAALGVEDLIIVATPETVLVVPLARSQEIRSLVEMVKGGCPPH